MPRTTAATMDSTMTPSRKVSENMAGLAKASRRVEASAAMHTVRVRPCQTSWRTLIFWLATTILRLVPPVVANESPTPSPPPPWQGELTAARTTQAAFALSPAKNEAEEKLRQAKLADVYRQLATKYPEAAPVQLAVGDGLAELDSPEAAVPHWQRAAKLDPMDPEAADALGSAFLRENRVQAAVEQYQRAVSLRPEVASYHASLANVLYLFRHQLVSPPALPDDQAVLRQALEHFRRAAELSPGSVVAAKAYAETFYAFAHPDWTQALAAWQAVAGLSGDNRDFASGHLARVSVRLGHKSEAEAYLSSIHDPAYNQLKTNLTKQIGRIGAATPRP